MLIHYRMIVELNVYVESHIDVHKKNVADISIHFKIQLYMIFSNTMEMNVRTDIGL